MALYRTTCVFLTWAYLAPGVRHEQGVGEEDTGMETMTVSEVHRADVLVHLVARHRGLSTPNRSNLSHGFPPELQGRFTNATYLGKGLNGVVFRALDTKHKSIPVAIKVLRKQNSCISECGVAQQIVKGCTPPWIDNCTGASHIVRCFDQGNPQLNGTTISWMASELVSGQDLNYYFQSTGMPSNWGVTLLRKTIAQFAEALNFMNQQGYQHDDLEGHFGNVMVENIDSSPKLYLLDFDRVSRKRRDDTNRQIRMYLWPLMLLPVQRGSRIYESCVEIKYGLSKLEQELAEFLFFDRTDISMTEEGSSTSDDVSMEEMQKLLLTADEKARDLTPSQSGYGALREKGKGGCLSTPGEGVQLFVDDVVPVQNLCHSKYFFGLESYCIDFGDSWMTDRWQQVCPHLGDGVCSKKPAKSVATFIASIWAWMFNMHANVQLYYDACMPLMTKERKQTWPEWEDRPSSCILTGALKKEIELRYNESSDVSCPDDFQCSIGSKFTLRLVCSGLCLNGDFGGEVLWKTDESAVDVERAAAEKELPCCLSPEIPIGKALNTKPCFSHFEHSIWDAEPILKAFPNQLARDAVLQSLWQGLLTLDGLAFLRSLLVEKAKVDALLKEPFVSKMLVDPPAMPVDAGEYSQATCSDASPTVIPTPKQRVTLKPVTKSGTTQDLYFASFALPLLCIWGLYL